MATETLRPNAAGDECDIPSQSGCSACPNHWDCVDEESADTNTYVVSTWQIVKKDLYNIPNSGIGAGTINKITIYFRVGGNWGHGERACPILKTHNVVYWGTYKYFTQSWETFFKEWTTNPNTGEAWTWDEINALQIGIAFAMNTSDYQAKCTQIYVVVDYTEAPTFIPTIMSII